MLLANKLWKRPCETDLFYFLQNQRPKCCFLKRNGFWLDFRERNHVLLPKNPAFSGCSLCTRSSTVKQRSRCIKTVRKMGKATSNPRPEAEAKSKSSVTVVKDVCAEPVSMLIGFLQRMGINSDSVPDICKTKDFYSHLIHHIIKPDQVLRGRITCLLTVNPALSVTNSSHFFLFFFFFFFVASFTHTLLLFGCSKNLPF